MADFVTLQDYFLARGYEKRTIGYWSGFSKKINNIIIYFLECRAANYKIIKFKRGSFFYKKIFTGLSQRPKTYIIKLIHKAEAASISDAQIKVFTSQHNGILPTVAE